MNEYEKRIKEIIEELDEQSRALLAAEHGNYPLATSMFRRCKSLAKSIAEYINIVPLPDRLNAVNEPENWDSASANPLISVVDRILEEETGTTLIFLSVALPVRPNYFLDRDKTDTAKYADEFAEACRVDLREYFRLHPRPPYDCPVDISITSVYTARRELRDYDNTVIKGLIDAIAIYLLHDDSPEEYRLHMSAEIGDRIGTVIRISPIVAGEK